MKIVRYETKINAVKTIVDALELDEDNHVHLGLFDNRYGLEYRVGSSLRDYHPFSLKEIIEVIPIEVIESSQSVSQFIFDMFMGSLLTMIKNTKWASIFLSDKYFTEGNSAILENFFHIITAQPSIATIRFQKVSVEQFLNNIKFDTRPCDFKGRYLEYNTLNVYAYTWRSTFKESDWVYKPNAFNTTKLWQGLQIIPREFEDKFVSKRIGTVWFTDLTLLLKAVIRDKVTYISYNLPDDLNKLCKKKKGFFYSDILDGLFSFADFYSTEELSSINNYVVTSEVFKHYVKSLDNDNFNSSFSNVLGALTN